MNYENKYLKYKSKYFKLKKYLGGAVGAIKNYNCLSCLDDLTENEAIFCSEKKHTFCWSCFGEAINGRSEDGRLFKDNGILKCTSIGINDCTGVFTLDNFLKIQTNDNKEQKIIKDEIVTKWTKVMRNLGPTGNSLDYWKKAKDDILKERRVRWKQAMKTKNMMEIIDIFALNYIGYSCPRCTSHSLNYVRCNALTCPVCKAGFCAVCLMDCGDDAHLHISKVHGDIYNRDLAKFNERERIIKGLIETIKDLSKNSETEKMIDPLFIIFKEKFDEDKITKELIFKRLESEKRVKNEGRQEEDIRKFAEKLKKAREDKLKVAGWK
jgi:hypothetical protein